METIQTLKNFAVDLLIAENSQDTKDQARLNRILYALAVFEIRIANESRYRVRVGIDRA